MTHSEIITFYHDRKERFKKQLAEVNRTISLISNGRLALAILVLTSLYFTFKNPAIFLITVLLITGFVYLIKQHTKAFNKKTHLENLVKINEQEGKVIQGDYSALDAGISFIDSRHPYAYDLDIFGEGSLFQYLNRCNTFSGKLKMAARLSKPLDSASVITANQEAVQEFSLKTEFRQRFAANGMEIDELPSDREQLHTWLCRPTFLSARKFYGVILIVIPILTVLFISLSFFIPQVKGYAILLVLFQWVFIGFHAKKIGQFHDYISRKKNILKKYARLLTTLQDEKFSANLNHSLQAQAREGDKEVKKLAGLVEALDARLNIFMFMLANSLLLYDLQCVWRLENWKARHANKLITWLETVSETEVLCSFGSFKFNNPKFPFAKIQSELAIEVEALGHPLIQQHERVSNDVTIGKEARILIITGANMAGKSTFLRTLGVNIILALNGAPVCAKKFACSVLNLRTGMRAADSLKDHQSYFYAELDRLKTIMDELRSDKPLLILLDEILKGTNSTDKQAGSIALVKQLIPHPCLALIATHDVVLGGLEEQFPNQAKNYYFEANIENEQLHFDYKLKPGVAQKMNATFLMKKMGIIPSN